MAFRVLYVDDSQEDRLLLKTILEQIEPTVRLDLVDSGELALSHLKTSTPNIILLDLNMPGLNGFEVLSRIKNDEQLKSIPVLLFTVSTASNHVNEAFQKGANAVISKPLTLDEYQQVFVDTFQFWKNIVKLPNS